MPTPNQIAQFEAHLSMYHHVPAGALTLDHTFDTLCAAGTILGLTPVTEYATPYIRNNRPTAGRIDVVWLRNNLPVAAFEVEGYWCTTASAVNDVNKFRHWAINGGCNFHRIILYRLATHAGCPHCIPWHPSRQLRDHAELPALAQAVPHHRARIEGTVAANNQGLGTQVLLDGELSAMFAALPQL